MADVVGTAYVRIKALTDQLAKEIEKGMKKGIKDADLERASKDKGDEIGEDIGDSTADSLNKTLKKRAKDIDSSGLLDGFRDATKDVQNGIDSITTDDFEDRLHKAFEVDDRGRFSKLFQRLRSNFKGSEDDAKGWASRLRAHFSSLGDDDTQGWITRMRTRFKSLTDDIKNGGALSKALDGLDTRFKKLGKSGGASLGFLRGAMLLIGGAIVAALPYIQDAGAAILAYATGLVAQIGFLTTAVGGLGVAAAAAIGSAALAALPIVLAFKSETEFLLDFTDSIKATGEEFLRIGTATQQTLLPALDEAAFILGDLIPMFSEFGFFVGRAVGNFALLAANILTGNEAQGRFQSILQSSLRILDMLIPIIINIGDILSGIWVAALPAAERFVGIIDEMIGRWTDMVNAGLRSGELTETFDIWFERARVLGSALGNLSGALFDILSVGADSSDNVFVRFDEWAERFRNFTESEVGQNKLALIFDNALTVMREVNAIAADLFDGIFGRLAEVGGVDSMVASLEKFRDVIPDIQKFWGEAYTTIKQVVELLASNVWDKITQTWEQMAEPLGRLGDQFLRLLEVMNESGAFDVFLDLMEILTNVLSTLLAIPGFGQFIAYFIAFNAALKIGALVLGPFIRLFSGFGLLLTNLIRLKAGAQLAGLAGGLQQFARGVKAANAAKGMQALTSSFVPPTAGAKSLATQLGKAAAPLLAGGPLTVGLGIAAAALVVGGGAFYLHQQKVQKWRQEIRQATEALGFLDGSLSITTDELTKYIKESSRFKSNEQIDDLERLGLSVSELSTRVVQGTIDYQDFADRALESGEVVARVAGNRGGGWEKEAKSLDELAKKYKLTEEELDNLSKGQKVAVEGGQLMLDGNDSLLESFKELNEVIGAAGKDNINAFVTNEQNMRLIGESRLGDLKDIIGLVSDDKAGSIMLDLNREIQAAAKKSAESITGISEATRDQIREQSTLSDGTVDWAKEEQLLTDALAKQNAQTKANFDLFASRDFARDFGPAKQAVTEFSDALTDMSFDALLGNLKGFDPTAGVDVLLAKIPEVATATHNLFTELSKLPADQFNAAATVLGVDADNLRDAMNKSQQAIIDLQEQALASLPSVGSLLDDATKTKEDGTQFFDTKGFVDSVNKRITDTKTFAANIKLIQEKAGDEAARLAAAQGPEAAAGLAKIAAADPDSLKNALQGLEDAETALTNQIRDDLGPGIAVEYAAAAGLIGSSFTGGLAAGLTDPNALKSLENASLATLTAMENLYKGKFDIVNGELTFVWTGKRTRLRGVTSGDENRSFSGGGFVGEKAFGFAFSSGPKGTDTVPAWLTPGEFVLRRAVAQAIPSKALLALNAGDPRIMTLLTSLNRSRPGGVAAAVVTGAQPEGGAASSSGITIGQMNIEAPTPLESARQVSNRLGILQTQLTRR